MGSSFNGLLVTVQHRFSNYFTLLTNYTYSHCLSGPPENGDNAGDQFQDPLTPTAITATAALTCVTTW